ncbi:hypothetical protein LTR86_009003 [Recurvomyces mirabilis]|nr:hypothetical protein LTR86_009003 [Recurvomyces mirabilis]
MAKTAKPKQRDISLHSRAARRGASPPSKDLLVKKSYASATATGAKKEESDYKPWLHSTQTGGISKNQKTKQLTRQQKVRAQKAVEKADAVKGKFETKVRDSKARSKRVQNRAKQWEELNADAGVGGVVGEGKRKKDVVGRDGEGDGEEGGGVWEDVEEDDVEEGGMDVEKQEVEGPGIANGGVAEQTTTAAGAEEEDVDEVT